MAKIIVDEIRSDPALKKYTLDSLPVLKRLRIEYFQAKTAVCIERAKYITEYMKQTEGSNEPMQIRRANAVRNYMAKRSPLFPDDNVLAGSTTSKKIGAPVYPEFLTGLGIWPELDTISTRKSNPQLLTKEEADILNFEVYPYWMDRTVLEVVRKERKDLEKTIGISEKLVFFLPGKAGTLSHTTPYYEEVLQTGLKAMMQNAKTKELDIRNLPATEETRLQVEFYQAVQIAMQGILDYADSLAAKAEEMAKTEASPDRKRNLLDMAAVCRNVPSNPASNYREAVNSLWLCHVGTLAENINMAMNPGRLDQILYPYFEKDIKENKLSLEEALTITGCLWFKLGDNANLVPETAEKLFGGAGAVPALTLGGISKDGKDAVNDLTYIMLRVTELLGIKDPNVNARYYIGINGEDYIRRVSDVIVNTKAIPAIYNDLANIKTLENQGVSTEHARDYAVIGCVELASAGREYTSSSSILMNLSAPFFMAMNNGKRPAVTGDTQIGPQTGDPASFATFDEFWNAYATQLKWLIQQSIDLNEALGKMHQRLLPTPLLSSFFQGPLDKGKDLIYGGALYNASGVTHVAFADICDSLNAIEFAVYQEKVATMQEIQDALNSNFAAPYERLHDYLKYMTPKYGTDHPVAQKNSKMLVKLLYDFYQEHTNYRGGKYRPAFWTMTNHAGLGLRAEALPSGRKAGEVFSSGITPSSQCTPDLPGAFLAVAALGSENIPGGVALNMKYTPPVSGQKDQYIPYFTGMLEGYFKSGGMQVQFNIQDYDTLIDAKAHPEKYPEMIVRVSGYSAYFKDLNEAMKDELIMRSQYNLESKKAVPLVKF